jgi:hypothetical protein
LVKKKLFENSTDAAYTFTVAVVDVDFVVDVIY